MVSLPPSSMAQVSKAGLADQFLQITTTEVQNQDVDNRTRGLLMHDIEAEIMALQWSSGV